MQLAWLGRGTGTSPFSRQGSRGLEMGSNLWFTLEELDRLQPRAPVTRQPLLRAASCDFRGWRVGLPFPPIPRPWGKFSQLFCDPYSIPSPPRTPAGRPNFPASLPSYASPNLDRNSYFSTCAGQVPGCNSICHISLQK